MREGYKWREYEKEDVCSYWLILKEQRGSTRLHFEESHLRRVNQITKFQICIDVQSEHNYFILSGVTRRVNYMFRPLYFAIIMLYLVHRVMELLCNLSTAWWWPKWPKHVVDTLYNTWQNNIFVFWPYTTYLYIFDTLSLDRTVWRTRFGRGYEPVVRQSIEWNE